LAAPNATTAPAEAEDGRAAPLRLKREASEISVLDMACRHPMRRRILLAAAQAPVSPPEFASRVDDDLSYVARHFRALRAVGLIEVVAEERRPGTRGRPRHLYALTDRFSAGLTDGAVLDLIADALDGCHDPLAPDRDAMRSIMAAVAASGRPVVAASGGAGGAPPLRRSRRARPGPPPTAPAPPR
jgi:DNA-binding transcriptional ArsR family regulator